MNNNINLIKAVSLETGVSVGQVRSILRATSSVVSTLIQGNKRVALTGVGTFSPTTQGVRFVPSRTVGIEYRPVTKVVATKRATKTTTNRKVR